MKKREPKKGYVYLLENTATSEYRLYKFGCTTTTPDKRCRRINAETAKYGYEFRVVAAFKSFDIFTDEHLVRVKILRSAMGMLGEIFGVTEDDGMPTTKDVIDRFLMIGGVLR